MVRMTPLANDDRSGSEATTPRFVNVRVMSGGRYWTLVRSSKGSSESTAMTTLVVVVVTGSAVSAAKPTDGSAHAPATTRRRAWSGHALPWGCGLEDLDGIIDVDGSRVPFRQHRGGAQVLLDSLHARLGQQL